MDLSTTFMGIKIANPLIVASSGLTNSVDRVKECADAVPEQLFLNHYLKNRL